MMIKTRYEINEYQKIRYYARKAKAKRRIRFLVSIIIGLVIAFFWYANDNRSTNAQTTNDVQRLRNELRIRDVKSAQQSKQLDELNKKVLEQDKQIESAKQIRTEARAKANAKLAVVSVRRVSGSSCRDQVVNLTHAKAAENGLDPKIALAISTHESGISCTGVPSRTHDCGPWQINLPTHPQFSCASANDPVASTNWAVPHIAYLVNTYGLRSGLAAYNAGIGGMKAGNGFGYADAILRTL